MNTTEQNGIASLRHIFEQMFDSRWSREELDKFDELREKFVFHMVDAVGDIRSLAAVYDSDTAIDAQQVEEVVYRFFLHAVPHLEAAGQIYDFVPMTFPEQAGVHFESELLDEYVDQLLEHHRLQSVPENHGDAINALLADLKSKSQSLSEFERRFVGGMSSDLTVLRKNVSQDLAGPPIEAAVRNQLLAHLFEENWSAMLLTLRANEVQMPSSIVAYLRGRCYFELGFYETAVHFLRYATQNDRQFAPSLVLPLLEVGAVDEAKKLVLDAYSHVNELRLHETFVLANGSCMLVEETADVSEAEQWLRRSIAIFKAAFDKVENLQRCGTNVDVFPGNYVAVAICHRMLHEFDDAKQWLEQAMRIDPDNDVAKQAYVDWFVKSDNGEDVAAENKTNGDLISLWQPKSISAFDRFVIKGAA